MEFWHTALLRLVLKTFYLRLFNLGVGLERKAAGAAGCEVHLVNFTPAGVIQNERKGGPSW